MAHAPARCRRWLGGVACIQGDPCNLVAEILQERVQPRIVRPRQEHGEGKLVAKATSLRSEPLAAQVHAGSEPVEASVSRLVHEVSGDETGRPFEDGRVVQCADVPDRPPTAARVPKREDENAPYVKAYAVVVSRGEKFDEVQGSRDLVQQLGALREVESTHWQSVHLCPDPQPREEGQGELRVPAYRRNDQGPIEGHGDRPERPCCGAIGITPPNESRLSGGRPARQAHNTRRT